MFLQLIRKALVSGFLLTFAATPVAARSLLKGQIVEFKLPARHIYELYAPWRCELGAGMEDAKKRVQAAEVYWANATRAQPVDELMGLTRQQLHTSFTASTQDAMAARAYVAQHYRCEPGSAVRAKRSEFTIPLNGGFKSQQMSKFRRLTVVCYDYGDASDASRRASQTAQAVIGIQDAYWLDYERNMARGIFKSGASTALVRRQTEESAAYRCQNPRFE